MNRTIGYFFRQQDLAGDEHIVLFHNGSVLLREDKIFWPVSMLQHLNLRSHHSLLVGRFQNRNCMAFALLDDHVASLNAVKKTPRQLLLERGLDDFGLIGQSNQLLNWLQSHRFCGHCGNKTVPHDSERTLVCPACRLHFYPRINPCVIVLVCREDKLLLARHNKASSPYFSCLAGFMEAGETPEETVAREVREEVGIEVENIRYIKSQSWPFPSQLMLGFFADYKSGEIEVDGKEIAEAHWYERDSLPLSPAAGISVAGQLIELFLQ
ncbi:MAG: NAD(+) diphosphatase, partial [Gammaproteobacteria bacterium]|nr:NAD(+) diphosphatase [Gammaproteobacteria bacterium]MDP2141101.1 NAD(+) diphosphatase [Gammaproteobacteria bacterium]MDP2349224.1 NAD(+) diphosphatase [Gammaproteobacteria bacterium]